MLLLMAVLVAVPEPGIGDRLPGWLAGHWCSERSEEFWLPARDGQMLGLNRQFGGSAGFEFLRIALVDDAVVFEARPGGRPAVVFTEVARGQRRISFANPQHDFPRRIHYWIEDGGLRAAIDGGDDAGRIEFGWSSCPG